MSVYVGQVMACLKNENWRYDHVAHMMADRPEELHELAAEIGLKRAWAQPNPGQRKPLHYDLTRSKRQAAIEAGAIPWEETEEGAFILRYRRGVWFTCDRCGKRRPGEDPEAIVMDSREGKEKGTCGVCVREIHRENRKVVDLATTRTSPGGPERSATPTAAVADAGDGQVSLW